MERSRQHRAVEGATLMSDDEILTAAQRIRATEKARAVANGQQRWGVYASEEMHRYAQPVTASCRRCYCCGGPITHAGMANGLALISGCELAVRRWVREPRGAAIPGIAKRVNDQ